jgi:hypothetical protein
VLRHDLPLARGLQLIQVEATDLARDVKLRTNLGGTRLPVSEADLATRADLPHAVRNLDAYRSTTAPALWERLQDLARSGGPARADRTRAFQDATLVERGPADVPRSRPDEAGRSGV